MSGRRGTATKPCSAADARVRLGSARQYLDACDVLELAGTVSNDVVASNAILAAIAAADAICCAARQEHAGSGNHNDAADLLKLLNKALGEDLARILSYKNIAAYSTRGISDAEVKTCRRVAGRLFAEAQRVLQAAPG